MTDAIITALLNQFAIITRQQIQREPEVRLVCRFEKNIKKLESEIRSIKDVLVDAEKRQVKEESVKLWLEKLKDVLYDAVDVLDEWILVRRRAEIEGLFSRTKMVWLLNSLPSCLSWKNRGALGRDIVFKVKIINQTLGDLAVEKERFRFNEFTDSDWPNMLRLSSIFFDESEIEGRCLEEQALISKMLSDKECLNIVSVVGIGGIGKTTLAKLVYNSDDVIRHFGMRFWVSVSDPFDEVRIAKAMLEDIEGRPPCLFELETVTRKIRNYVQGKRFLLVLDDVRTEDFRDFEQLFNSLQVGAAGSRIVVTTRNERVAKVMGSSYRLRLGSLSEADSWSLFKKIASFEPKGDEYERLGKEIAKNCRGLPLGITTVGSVMRFKNSLQEWEDVLNSEFWEMEVAAGGPVPVPVPPLMLSYFDLPSPMKLCFSYCALFPKDYVIEANDLIQLWMAEGFLLPSEKVEMEVIGQDYLQHLAMRSFFQDLVRDKEDRKRILSCKMHDLVRDLACYLTENDCSVIEFNNGFQQKTKSYHRRARHLTVLRAQDMQFPHIPNVKKLFTLRVVSPYDSPPYTDQFDRIEPDLIRRASSLRVLDLSRNRIGELPKEISYLIKLRYLNLSYNPIWELPEAMCELHSLKSLKLSFCTHLQKLPSRISELGKLRHLEIEGTDSLKTLPKGFGNLRSLRVLTKFIIVNDTKDATCGLEDLKHLNNLQGCLKIEGLGYAAEADEAKKAELHKKIHLSDLEMDFSPSILMGKQDEVIEALEVHENLKSLQISSYGGMKLPNWMMKLTNLKTLFLQDCQNCKCLPPLGRLPSLVTLHLEGMKAINYLGLEFLGVHRSYDSNGDDESEALSAFPKLEKLMISKMENWEEVINGSFEVNFCVMPRLRCLKISHCSKLKELPPLLLQKTPLRKLHIDNCPLLLQRYSRETGEDWSKISHISKIRVS